MKSVLERSELRMVRGDAYGSELAGVAVYALALRTLPETRVDVVWHYSVPDPELL